MFTKFRRLVTVVVIVALVLLALFFTLFYFREYITNYFVHATFTQMDVPQHTRLLVLSPHPDDGVIAAGGLMERVLATGGTVKVVYVTAGDGFEIAAQDFYHRRTLSHAYYQEYAYTRYQETKNALGSLGIGEQNISWLGFPDGGTNAMWNASWATSAAYTSPYSGFDKTAYSFSYHADQLYNAANAVEDLQQIINAYQPTMVVMPGVFDLHPDHNTVYRMGTVAVLNSTDPHAAIYYYIVHHGFWPTPQGLHEDTYLVPPADVIRLFPHWQSLDLSTQEVAGKKNALERYRSQMITIGDFILSYVRQNEIFYPYEPHRVTLAAPSLAAAPSTSTRVSLPIFGTNPFVSFYPGSRIDQAYVDFSPETVTFHLDLADETDYRMNYEWSLKGQDQNGTYTAYTFDVSGDGKLAETTNGTAVHNSAVQLHITNDRQHIVLTAPASMFAQNKWLFIDAKSFNSRFSTLSNAYWTYVAVNDGYHAQ